MAAPGAKSAIFDCILLTEKLTRCRPNWMKRYPLAMECYRQRQTTTDNVRCQRASLVWSPPTLCVCGPVINSYSEVAFTGQTFEFYYDLASFIRNSKCDTVSSTLLVFRRIYIVRSLPQLTRYVADHINADRSVGITQRLYRILFVPRKVGNVML